MGGGRDLFDDYSTAVLGKPPAKPAPVKIAPYKPLAKTTGNKDFDSYYDNYGKEHDIDPNLLFAQGGQESSFNPKAVSPKNARGISQFIPATAAEFGVNVNDPGSSIKGQAKMMRQLLDRTGDIELALAGYNSGHNLSPEALKRNRQRIPETRGYVDKILKNYQNTPEAAQQTSVDLFSDYQSAVGSVPEAQGAPVDLFADYQQSFAPVAQPNSVPPPVSESPATIQAQAMSALNPNQTARVAILLKPEEVSQLGDSAISQFIPLPQADGRTLFVAKQSGRKLGLRTPQDVEKYVKKNGFAKLIGKVDDVGTNTAQGPAVSTIDPVTGTELTSSIVTSPESAQQQAAIDQASFPGSVSTEMPAQDVVAKRLKDLEVLQDFQPVNERFPGSGRPEVTIGTPLPIKQAQKRPVKQKQPQFGSGVEVSVGELSPESPQSETVSFDFDLRQVPKGQSAKTYVEQETAARLANKYNVPFDAVLGIVRRNPPVVKDGSKADEAYYESIRDGFHGTTINESVIEEIKRAKPSTAKTKQLEETTERYASKYPEALKDLAELDARADMGEIDRATADKFIKAEMDAYAKTDFGDSVDQQAAKYHGGQIADDAQKSRQGKIAEILKEYGSFTNYQKEQERIKAEENDPFRQATRPYRLAGESAKSVGRYISSIPATVLEAAAIAKEYSIPQLAYDYLSGTEGKASESEMFKAAQSLRENIEKDPVLQKDKDLRNNWIVNELSEGIAQVGVQMVLAPFTGGASLALPLAEGVTSQYKEADKAGASKTHRLIAGIAGGALAVPDMLLKAKYLRFLTPAQKTGFLTNMANKMFGTLAKEVGEQEAKVLTRNFLTTALKNGAFGTAGEYGTERLEDVGNDIVEKLTYNPKKEIKVLDRTAEEEKGYKVAALLGLFGGSVETVSQLSQSQIEKAPSLIDEALKEGKIAPAEARAMKADIAKITPEDLETKIQQVEKDQKARTIKESLTVEAQETGKTVKPDKSAVEIKETVAPLVSNDQNDINDQSSQNKGQSKIPEIQNVPTSTKDESGVLAPFGTNKKAESAENVSLPDLDTKAPSFRDIDRAEILARPRTNRMVIEAPGTQVNKGVPLNKGEKATVPAETKAEILKSVAATPQSIKTDESADFSRRLWLRTQNPSVAELDNEIRVKNRLPRDVDPQTLRSLIVEKLYTLEDYTGHWYDGNTGAAMYGEGVHQEFYRLKQDVIKNFAAKDHPAITDVHALKTWKDLDAMYQTLGVSSDSDAVLNLLDHKYWTKAYNPSAVETGVLYKARDPESEDMLSNVAQHLHTEELLPELKGGAIKDGDLELNEFESEQIRRLLTEKTFRETGTEPDEKSFDGMTWSAKEANDTVKLGRELILDFKRAGYTDTQLKGYTKLLDNIEKSVEGSDYGILFVFDDALPEEKFHKEDLTAGRTDNEAIKRLKTNPLWKGGAQFNREYSNVSEADRASEIAAKLATGQEKKYGWDKIKHFEKYKQAFLNNWIDGILRKNSVETEAELDKFITKFERIGIYAALKTDNQRAEGTDRRDESPVGSDTKAVPREQEKEGRQGSEKVRSLPQTLRDAGLEAADETYAVFGNQSEKLKATEKLKELGLEDSVKYLENAEVFSKADAILSFQVQAILRNEAAQADLDNETKLAEQLRQKALDIGSKHARLATEAGAFNQAAAIVSQTVQGVINLAYKTAESKKKTLTTTQIQRFEQLGTKGEDQLSDYLRLQAENTRLQKEIADLKAGKIHSKPVSKKVVDRAKSKLPDTQELLKQLKAQIKAKQDDVLKSVAKTANPFAQYGASLILDKPLNQIDRSKFYHAMLKTFGQDIEPELANIFAESFNLRQELLAEARKEASIERLKAEFPGKTNSEVEQIYKDREKDRKEKLASGQMAKTLAGLYAPTKAKQTRDLIERASELGEDAEVADLVEKLFTHEVNPKDIDRSMRSLYLAAQSLIKEAKISLEQDKDAIQEKLAGGEQRLKEIRREEFKQRHDFKETQSAIARELRRLEEGPLKFYAKEALKMAGETRAVMASGDLSGSLRQGLYFTVTDTKKMVTGIEAGETVLNSAYGTMLSAFSEGKYADRIKAIEEHPDFPIMVQSGIEFADAGQSAFNLTKAEENIRTEYAKKIPVLKKWLELSERTYAGFLDQQRALMAHTMFQELYDQGATFKTHPEEFKAIAYLINIATGRGQISNKKLESALSAFGNMFFAPSYMVSRFQLVAHVFGKDLLTMSPAARRIAYKRVARFHATMTLPLMALAAMGLVSLDPDDDDFLKIKPEMIANKFLGTNYKAKARYEILGGMQPTIRFLGRQAKNGVQVAAGQEKIEKGTGDALYILGRFGRGKLAPVPSFAVDYATNKDFMGKPFDWKTATASRLAPLTLKELYNGYNEDGLYGSMMTIPTFFGVGSAYYEDKPRETKKK
jgi:hypothetical protein